MNQDEDVLDVIKTTLLKCREVLERDMISEEERDLILNAKKEIIKAGETDVSEDNFQILYNSLISLAKTGALERYQKEEETVTKVKEILNVILK